MKSPWLSKNCQIRGRIKGPTARLESHPAPKPAAAHPLVRSQTLGEGWGSTVTPVQWSGHQHSSTINMFSWYGGFIMDIIIVEVISWLRVQKSFIMIEKGEWHSIWFYHSSSSWFCKRRRVGGMNLEMLKFSITSLHGATKKWIEWDHHVHST